MGDYTTDDDVRDHLLEVGLLCSKWAYLEWLFEITHWWLIGLLHRPDEGRVITGTVAIDNMARRVRDLAHLKITGPADLATLKNLADRIAAANDERNLAVHGLRSLRPDDMVTGEVARGKYKGQPQRLSLVRLRSLSVEVDSMMAALEEMLVRLNVLEGMTELSARQQSPPPKRPG